MTSKQRCNCHKNRSLNTSLVSSLSTEGTDTPSTANTSLELTERKKKFSSTIGTTSCVSLEVKKANSIIEKSVQDREQIRAIRLRFPTKVPVLITRHHGETFLPLLGKPKFMIEKNYTMLDFIHFFRNKLKIPSSRALVFLINEKIILNLKMPMGEAYKLYAQRDGFLHITYQSEKTFG